MSEYQQTKMTGRRRLAVVAGVAKMTYQVSPLATIMKLAGSAVSALIPLVTVYFAAETTTALAMAFSGDVLAGGKAMRLIAITILLGLFMKVWQSVESYINELASHRINSAVSDKLYEHLVVIEYWRYDDMAVIDMFDRAQNFSLFFSRLFDVVSRAVESFIQLGVGLIALATVSWWVGLLLMVAVIPSAVVQLKVSKLQTKYWRKNTENRRKFSAINYQIFQPINLGELRLYGVAKEMLKLRSKYRDRDYSDRLRFEKEYMFWRIGSDFVEAIAEIIAIFYIAVKIINQTQPIGQFVFVQQMTSRVIDGMRQIVTLFSDIDEDLSAMVDYDSFLRLPTANAGGSQIVGPPRSIVFRNVSFRYPNSTNLVLNTLDFEIRLGDRVSFVGENGAGKTTLVKLLTGLYKPLSGEILIDGVQLGDIDEYDWHRQLSTLGQNFIRYDFATTRDNVIYGDVGSRFNPARYKQALSDAEASQFVAKLPKGDQAVLNQWFEHSDGTPGVELSGGQWQRLALARSFYRDSPIIVLDEPTSAIDALAESRIFKRLLAQKRQDYSFDKP